MSSPVISRRSFAAGAATLPVAIAGLAPAVASAQSDQPIKAVATFSILADWVQNVLGDLAVVTSIVPPDGDAHTFDPNPEQVAAIAEADLIFEIGLGFETWLDSMVSASGSDAVRVVVSDGIEVLHFEENGEAHDDDHEDEHDDDHEDESHEDDHDHGADDPHIWGDVANGINAVNIIASALAETDPDNAATWQANADAYIAQLEDLDASIRTDTATIPEDQRKLVTTHDTFGYYALAYAFVIAGTALNSISTGGPDASAQDIAALVENIQDENVPAIFAENVSNNALMESIAAEAGVELAPALYTDALSESGGDAGTYIDMMTWNTGTIVTALT